MFAFRQRLKLNAWIGAIVGVIIALKMAAFSERLHENLLWFSNIKEMEREISFRTEQGLYYSYYKQLLNNKQGLISGILDLRKDNFTEHGRSINVLQRFNIYQEIVLATIYKVFSLKMDAAVFYTSAVFTLQFATFASVYACSWLLSGTWTSGVAALALFLCNFDDATRVHHTTPLREHFSLPFVFAQMAFVTSFLKRDAHPSQQWTKICCILVTTFLYTLTWQFAQFIALMQVTVVLSLAFVNQINLRKAFAIAAVHGSCLASVCCLQFGNEMMIGSWVASLVPIGTIVLFVQTRVQSARILRNAVRATVQFASTLLATVAFNFFIRTYVLGSQSADEHILKFIGAKFGSQDPRDFETRLYLCIDAFQPLGSDTYERLTESLLLPLYAVVVFFGVAALVYRVLDDWESGDGGEFPAASHVSYNFVHSVAFCALAASTTRMKCLWVPHACVVTSYGIADPSALNAIGGWTKTNVKPLRHVVAVTLMAVLSYRFYPALQTRLGELHEFWDPETVQLMEWIKDSTPATSAFAGSMQLLASVRLCTGRPVTNHPHFEDEWLRQRTKQVYKIYSRVDPLEVHRTLRTDIGADYVILENSICLAQSDGECKLIDILDLKDGIVPESGSPIAGLRRSTTPRFCREIQNSADSYARYFTLVFTNRLFNVFRVLSV